MGLTFPCNKTSKSNFMFEQKFYGSLHVVYRMQKMHNLNQHKGCVNSINFHPKGKLVTSVTTYNKLVNFDYVLLLNKKRKYLQKASKLLKIDPVKVVVPPAMMIE